MSDSDEKAKQSEERERELKVTDRRMFTPDGRLREEYASIEEEKGEGEEGRAARQAPPRRAASPGESAAGGPAAGPAPPRGSLAGSPQAPPGGAPDGAAAEGPGRVEIPSTGPEGAKPGFFDLVAVLAEPVSIYLGDAELPDGRKAENLDAARLYIDLLDVLREKTRSNLTAQESRVLDDLLYRLRMRHVEKRG